MKTAAYLHNPEKMEATVEITMTIADFEHYLKQTEGVNAWPSWKIRTAISSIVTKARSHFTEKLEDT